MKKEILMQLEKEKDLIEWSLKLQRESKKERLKELKQKGIV